MPIIVPVIIIGANAVGIAAGGYSAARGAMKIRRANKIATDARELHGSAVDRTNGVRTSVQEVIDAYAQQRIESSVRVLERMVGFLRSNDRLAEVSGIEPLSELPMEPDVLEPIALDFDTKRAAGAVVGAAKVAVASPAALAQLATNVGKASTGTAIKTLSGAAGKNATLAWLGGGAKAVGGGGVALGGVMGPLTAVGTAVTVLGMGTNVAGEQYLTSATAKAAQLDVAVGELELHESYLDGIRVRTHELAIVLRRATDAAEKSLQLLEQLTLDEPESERHFARSLQLVIAVSEIIRTPILGDAVADRSAGIAEDAGDPSTIDETEGDDEHG